MATTSSLKTAVVRPGECVILPAGAVVTAVVVNGSASATNSCGDLPDPTSYKCGYFYIIIDVDSNDGHSMDELYTQYQSITVAGNTYIINENIVTGDNPGTLVPVSTLNIHITDTALFEFMDVQRTVLSKRQSINVYFKVPEALYDSVKLKVDNHGSVQIYEPIDHECDDYPVPE